MRNLTATICLTLAVLLGSTGVSFSLPACPSDQDEYYDNCFGTYTYANGNKYVGEFKDEKFHGQGTYTFSGGGIQEGAWEDGIFQYPLKVTPPVGAHSTLMPSSSDYTDIGNGEFSGWWWILPIVIVLIGWAFLHELSGGKEQYCRDCQRVTDWKVVGNKWNKNRNNPGDTPYWVADIKCTICGTIHIQGSLD